MAAFKTHNLLPEIFRTETNKKFLNATLDQLISEPNFTRINGYIGRKFAPTYNSTDSYVPEIDRDRRNYQLEPSVVVKNPESGYTDFYAGYADIINKIGYYGGKTDNHSRLFNSDTYSFDGKFDFDKFVNFSQYYWLANGPDPVTVSATGVEMNKTFTVNVNTENGAYYFDGNKNNVNPDITLAQGGVYEFILDGLTGSFWIQTEPGETGYNVRRPNVYTRDVYGVYNNGSSTGTVTFKVPKLTAQSKFINMPKKDDVDFASLLSYREIQGATTTQIKTLGGFDGPLTSTLQGKRIIFVNPTKIDDYYWTDTTTSAMIAKADRNSTWTIDIDQFGVINLSPYAAVAVNEKVYVKSGTDYASKSFYVNYRGSYDEVPLITCNLSKLYYQNGETSSAVGLINVVAVSDQVLDPATDIIGKKNFTSANGVAFTNGLKITFDSSVTSAYANKTYFVEGVGKSIVLIPFDEMIAVNEWNNKLISRTGGGYAVGDVLTVTGGIYERPAKLLVTDIAGEVDAADFVAGRVYRIQKFGDTYETATDFAACGADVAAVSTINGYIVDNVLYAVSVPDGQVAVGQFLFGDGIPPGTKILHFLTGTGNEGTYQLSTSSTVGSFLNQIDIITLTKGTVFTATGPGNGTGTAIDGRILNFQIIDSGEYLTLPTNPVSVTGGSGIGGRFTINLQPATPDYITINRGSLSRNSWSRQNRWVHADVIRATAAYRGEDPIIDQALSAKRPIIEFDPDIRLFNSGAVGASSVDLIDTLVENVFLEIESLPAFNSQFAVVKSATTIGVEDIVAGRTYSITSVGTTDFKSIGATGNIVGEVFVATSAGTGSGTVVDSVLLFAKSKIIFSNDQTLENRRKIYDFDIVDIGANTAAPDIIFNKVYTIIEPGTTNFMSAGAPNNNPGTTFTATNAAVGTGVARENNFICVVLESGETVETNTSTLVRTGRDAGNEYWFDGINWIKSQSKITTNQEPLFDVFDADGISFGDQNTYTTSNFTGTKLFSYKRGTGADDTILKFPLSYRNFENIGDIQFENNFDADTFDFLVTPRVETKALNTGYLHITTGLNTYTHSNMWTTTVEKSKQYQLISHIADGVNNLFEIDIVPNASTVVPNIKVTLNSKSLTVNDFGLSKIGARYAVLINPTLLSAGDAVDIAIYSDTVSKLGFYQVPLNLDNNAENSDFASLTLGQLRNHLITLSENSLNISGSIVGANNVRDIDIKKQSGNILKHSAPTIYSQLFLADETMNFVNGVRLAQKEYAKFKNKFLEISETIDIDVNDIAGSVDSIIVAINGIKNINFPWYYSDMVPWGTNKTVLPEYTVLELQDRRYDLSRIFDDTALSNRAVLVYHARTVNGVTTKTLMVKDRDYVFNLAGPNFRINDSFNLNYGDKITVVEYTSTDGNFIPETPTKLGLWPKYVPEIYEDNTYVETRNVIQGHDGSITVAFNDFRDDLLLELERRIYNNIKVEFQFPDIINYIPGKFRVGEYTTKEFNQILSNNFLSWVGNNRLDYTTNDYFESNNPWTWNYKNFKDSLTGDFLPGTWRAIYKYFYDTDRPHTHPWEMLGFSSQPDWWIGRYGTAPYTGGNLNLWNDLSIGYIHAGPRQGIDKRYARPGLLQIIPVDDAGNLRSPEQFVVLDYDGNRANVSYAVGDFGPIETAWRRSSDFAFAMQITIALMKPAEYFGKLAAVSVFNYNSKLDQYVVTTTNKHVKPTDIIANGYLNEAGEIVREAGYVNWITEYLKNMGINDPQTKIHDYLNYLTVQLSYKVGGFTDKNYIELLAEQGSPSSKSNGVTVPDENYQVILNKSVPVNKVVYSGVIVERSQGGYTVSGYNLNNPYFTIVPSQPNNNFYKITAGATSAIVYRDYQKVRVKIPYGYEFTTQQAVVDFLIAYQRQLQSLGFVFSKYNDDLQAKQDWVLSAKEFLTWAQQGWGAHNIIILSPVNDALRHVGTNSVVDEITNTPFGSKLLNPNFAVIKSSSFTVNRDNNRFDVATIDGQTIAYAELNLVQYEHVVILDNTTVFNDVLYAPETGNRQYRLKIMGYRTGEWTGALNPPGFIFNSDRVDEWQPGKDYRKGQLVSYKNFYYTSIVPVTGTDIFDTKVWKQIDQDRIKTGLLPNMAAGAGMFGNFYDFDNPPASENLNFYSSGITGFRERSYLTDLSLDNITQGKFYSGFIKQKGTKNAILALASAKLTNVVNEVNIYEEWALRVGDYGATGSNEFVEIEIDEQIATSNPVPIEFLDSKQIASDGVITVRPNNIYKASENNTTNMFESDDSSAERPWLPTAGYVNVDDVDRVIFDLANYRALSADLNTITTGYTIWTAKDFTGNWNVFRVNDTNNLVVNLAYSLDNVGTITTIYPHGLVENDIIAIKDFNELYNGFYQVYSIVDATSVNIVLISGLDQLKIIQNITGTGYLFKLTSSRVNSSKDIDNIVPESGWLENDKVWVDNLDNNGNWGVYNKTTPWDYTAKAVQNSVNWKNIIGNDGFGSSIAVTPDGKRMYVGAQNGGKFITESAAAMVSGQAYRISYLGTTNFRNYGSPTNTLYYTFIANGPGTGTGRVDRRIRPGRLIVLDKQDNGEWQEVNNLLGKTEGDLYGSTVLLSNKTLVVSAPGKYSGRGVVYVYDITGDISLIQMLVSPTGSAGARFGSGMAMSEDGEWLYISEGKTGKVHAYGWNADQFWITEDISSGTTTATIKKTTTASDIFVRSATGFEYVPEIHYTVDNAESASEDVSVTTAATGTSGSSILTVDDATGIAINQFVTGHGVPGNTYVASVSGTDITLTTDLVDDAGGNYTFSIPGNGSDSNSLILFSVSGITVGDEVTGYGVQGGTYVTSINSGYKEIILSKNRTEVARGTYTFSSPTITFSSTLTEDVIVIHRPNYKLVQQQTGYTFRDPNNLETTAFGVQSALSCNADGSMVIVGAPAASNNGYNTNGAVYVYNRTIEKFIADGTNDTFVSQRPLNDSKVYKVRVNGVLQKRNSDYLVDTVDGNNVVVFDSESIPEAGTWVTIENNYFGLMQTIDGTLDATKIRAGESYTIASLGSGSNITPFASIGAQSNTVGVAFRATATGTGNGRVMPGVQTKSFQQLGTSTVICPNSCSLYAGAVSYTESSYYQGAVYRFVNQGKLYGEVIGNRINPMVTAYNTIIINGIEVVITPASVDNLVVGKRYKIVETGYTIFEDLGAANSSIGTEFTATATGLVNETDFVVGRLYKIKSLGTTTQSEWNTIAGTSGQTYIVGSTFTAAAVGTGDGTATQGIGKVTGLTTVIDDINAAYIPGVTAYDYNGYIRITSDVISLTDKLDIVPGRTLNSEVGSTVVADLGIDIFVYTQLIKHPGVGSTERFGAQLKISPDAGQLAVGSNNAATIELTTFDTDKTSFDAGSMQFRDEVANSGAVYLYDLLDNPFATVTNPALLSYVQQLQGPGIQEGFAFGTSMSYVGDRIFVSATKDNTNGIQLFVDLNGIASFLPSGSVYEFHNTTGQQGWDLIRYREPRTDVRSISKIYLYNKKTQNIVATLDVYDPVKGKLLGVAEQDIDYRSEFDPASYNDSAGSDYQYQDINELYHWGPAQIGRTWWDLSQVRFVDYEQDTLVYRNKHWGTAVAGSTFKVYEWVESNVVPSRYVANGGVGIPKYENNEQYVSHTFVDPSTGVIQVKYYYWVSDKASIDYTTTTRVNSSFSLQQILANPKEQGIPYAAPIAKNAISLFNITEYLVDTDIVLHIDHSPIQNTNIIHTEYELIKEGDNSELPTRVIEKLKDSLAGVNSSLLPVPDPKLKVSERYGVELRPRQTMFVDRLTALENFVKFSNNVFSKYPVVDRSDLVKLFTGEDLPIANSGEWDMTVNNYLELTYLDTTGFDDGYLVAVLADENHDKHWTIYEWVDHSVTYTGNGSRTLYKLGALPRTSDDIVVTVNSVVSTDYIWSAKSIKFNSAPADGATIEIRATQGWTLRRIQSYLTNLYWKKVDWYDTTFDYTEKTTYTVNNHFDIEKLVLAEGNTVKVLNDGDGRYAYYRMSSTGEIDRVGSQDSTIEIISSVYDLASNRLGYDAANYDNVRYDQYPVNEIRFLFEAIVEDIMINDIRFEFNDLFFSLVNYIFSEQANPDWIFKSSFITVLHKVRELAQYPSFIKSNETSYEDYINEVKPYRTKIREYVQKQTGTDYMYAATTDFDLPGYYDTESGTYRSPNGTSSTDAALLASGNYVSWNNNHTYKVYEIAVANGGSGFNFIPNITIAGGGGAGATADAIVSNGSITSVEVITSGTGYTSTPLITVSGPGTGAVLVPKLKTEFFAPNIAQSYNTVRSVQTKINFDRVVDSTNQGRRFESNVVQWTANTSYAVTFGSGTGTGNVWLVTGNLIAYGGDIYVPLTGASSTNQPTFDRNLYSVMDQGNVLIKGIDRVYGYYQPATGMLSTEIEALVNATEYPGVKVSGAVYTANTFVVSRENVFAFNGAQHSITSSNIQLMNFLSFTDNLGVPGRAFAKGQQLRVYGSAGNDSAFKIESVTTDTMILSHSQVNDELNTGANITLRYLEDTDLGTFDAVISSEYLDTSLGVRAEDINVDGGAYVDTYNSYGPEELLPGRMYDTLEMRVFTTDNTTEDTSVYYIGRVNVNSIGFGYYDPTQSATPHDWNYVGAADIVAGQRYEIISQGTVDYTTLGAANNNAGTVFTATGTGYGTGNVASLLTITVNGISNADLSPVLAANGALISITINSGGDTLANTVNPSITITGANVEVATATAYITQDTYGMYGYRVFHSMNASNDINPITYELTPWLNSEITYHRISGANTTVLTSDFSVTDNYMYVEDASILPDPNPALSKPGIIFVNGEKINYFSRDLDNNRLGYLRRAVDGTGAANVHTAGTRVVNAGLEHVINPTAVFRTFNNSNAELWGNLSANIGGYSGTSNVFAGSSTFTSNEGSPLVNGEVSLADIKSYFGQTGDFVIRTELSFLNVGATTPADGTGLANSGTSVGLFIKDTPSYTP